MSVTAAAGFRAAAIAAGIKQNGRLDLSLVASDRGPVPAAAVFTRSETEAAPVTISREHVADGMAAAVILNSGCANAGTGQAGLAAARSMAKATAAALLISPSDVLVCSTGPIGPQLPDGLTARVPDLITALGSDGLAAAEGILTTDSHPKQAADSGDGWTVGGMAKGAGMVRPDMATMLAVLTTDAVCDAATLREVLAASVGPTFNSLNIDGCQSTNDTVVLLASGVSQVRPEPEEFAAAVTGVCRRLAMAMAEDAEGASRVVTLRVFGADSPGDARRLGMAVADSALVRASFYGGDPNWGRIYGALGVAGVSLSQGNISVAYQGVLVARDGAAVAYDHAGLVHNMADGSLAVDIGVGQGPGEAVVVTTDLTPEYVVFNGEPS